jgi:hypothetical protein
MKMVCESYGVFIAKGATNSLKIVDIRVLWSVRLVLFTQRSKGYIICLGIYPKGIPKEVCVHEVPSVRSCTICKHTSGGPFSYVRTRDKGIRQTTLVYIWTEKVKLGFILQMFLGYKYVPRFIDINLGFFHKYFAHSCGKFFNKNNHFLLGYYSLRVRTICLCGNSCLPITLS